jgi:hypothetical protein
MDRYGGPQSALSIALHRFLYLAIIIDPYGGPQSALTIALHRGLYLAIIMDPYGWSLMPLVWPCIEASI